MRPEQGGRISEKQAHAALDKYAAGQQLNAREQRFIEYAKQVKQQHDDAYDAQLREFQQDQADESSADIVQAKKALQAGSIPPADHAEALTLQQLVSQAYDAGADPTHIIDATFDGTPAEQARRLWDLTRQLEEQHGTDTRAIAPRRENGTAAPDEWVAAVRAGQAEEGGNAPGARSPAAGRVGQPSDLFADATPQERLAAEQKRRDGERNGLGRDLVRPEQGEGELLAGERPKQDVIPAAERIDVHRQMDELTGGNRVKSSSRDMFTTTRGDRAAPETGREQGIQVTHDEASAERTRDGAGEARPQDVRPDWTPSLGRRGKYEIDALVRRFDGSTLADTIAREFRETDTAQLIGKHIGSNEDLAAMLSVYRNPIFETAHYFFVDDAWNILGESAVSSRLPSSSAMFPDGVEGTPHGIAGWIDDVAPEGATGVWISHNHPSANPTPSQADIDFTGSLNIILQDTGSRVKLLGHVVTDHDTYGHISPSGDVSHIGKLHVRGNDPLRNQSPSASLSDYVFSTPIKSPNYAALVAKDIYELTPNNSVAVVNIGARGHVISIATVPAENLATKRGFAMISRMAGKSGAAAIHLIGDRQILHKYRSQLEYAELRGLFHDVLQVNPDGRIVSHAIEGYMNKRDVYGNQTAALRAKATRGAQVFEERNFDDHPSSTPPSETDDVPRGQQIVKFGREPSMDEGDTHVTQQDRAATNKISQQLSDHIGKPVSLVPANELPHALRRAFDAFDGIVGGKTRAFENNTPQSADFLGVTMRDGQRFVNVTSDVPLLQVAVHEFGHDLRKDRPDLWKELGDHMEQNGDIDAYLDQLKKNAKAGGFDPESINRDEAHDELVSDAMGDAMVDPWFLERLAKNNPTLFAKVAAYFKQALDSILSRLKDMGSNKYVRDVQAFRDKLEDVLTRYATERTGGPRAASGEDLAMSRRSEPDQQAGIAFSRKPAANYTPEQQEFMKKAGMGDVVDTRTAVTRALDAIRGVKVDIPTDALVQGTINQFHGIKRAVEEKGGIAPENNPFLAAEMIQTASTMEAILRFGAPELHNGALRVKRDVPGLMDALTPVANKMPEFLGWMVARRAKLLKAQGRENAMSDADIAAGLSLSKGYTPEFNEAAEDYSQLKGAILDLAEQSGIIDPEARKVWDHAEYIPFYRDMDGGAGGPGTRQGLANQSSGIKKLKGGDSPLKDPLGNIIANFTRLVDASMKNRAMLLAVDQLGSPYFRKAPLEMKPETIPLDQVKKHLLANGTPKALVDSMPPSALRGVGKMLAVKAPEGDDIVRVMRNGKAEYYHVDDPLLLRSLTALHEGGTHWSLKPFSFLKNLLTAGATARTRAPARCPPSASATGTRRWGCSCASLRRA